jgi:hypothetical protein
MKPAAAFGKVHAPIIATRCVRFFLIACRLFAFLQTAGTQAKVLLPAPAHSFLRVFNQNPGRDQFSTDSV